MRPVQEAAEIVPLVHAAEAHPVAEADRDTLCELDVVGDQQGLPLGQPQDESLVACAVTIIRQQARYVTGVLDPAPAVGLAVGRVADAAIPR